MQFSWIKRFSYTVKQEYVFENEVQDSKDWSGLQNGKCDLQLLTVTQEIKLAISVKVFVSITFVNGFFQFQENQVSSKYALVWHFIMKTWYCSQVNSCVILRKCLKYACCAVVFSCRFLMTLIKVNFRMVIHFPWRTFYRSWKGTLLSETATHVLTNSPFMCRKYPPWLLLNFLVALCGTQKWTKKVSFWPSKAKQLKVCVCTCILVLYSVLPLINKK